MTFCKDKDRSSRTTDTRRRRTVPCACRCKWWFLAWILEEKKDLSSIMSWWRWNTFLFSSIRISLWKRMSSDAMQYFENLSKKKFASSSGKSHLEEGDVRGKADQADVWNEVSIVSVTEGSEGEYEDTWIACICDGSVLVSSSRSRCVRWCSRRRLFCGQESPETSYRIQAN